MHLDIQTLNSMRCGYTVVEAGRSEGSEYSRISKSLLENVLFLSVVEYVACERETGSGTVCWSSVFCL